MKKWFIYLAFLIYTGIVFSQHIDGKLFPVIVPDPKEDNIDRRVHQFPLPEHYVSFDERIPLVYTLGTPHYPGRAYTSWFALRNAYIGVYPTCEACGTKKKLNVHHIIPERENYKLVLEWTNLITMCRRHHFTQGHMMNWKTYNPDVRELVKIYRKYYNDRKKNDGDPDT